MNQSPKICAFAVVLFVTGVLITSAVDVQSGIYGNAGVDYKDGGYALVHYDPNTGNINTVSSSIDSDAVPLRSTIDEINSVYYYLTDIDKHSVRYGALIPFNLTNPTNAMQIIEIPSCLMYNKGNNGEEQFVSNPLNGDMYLICHSKQNAMNQSDLYKLQWNNKVNTLNMSLIKSYGVGSAVTVDTEYPAIFDSKRNTLWALETYSMVGVYFNNYNVLNGYINKQIPIDNWMLQSGIYSHALDKIVTLNFKTIYGNDNQYYVDINVVYADAVSAEIVDNIGGVNMSNHYCNASNVYTMDTNQNRWYQLMYRRQDYSPCRLNNEVFYGDLLTIDVEKALVINAVSICQADVSNGYTNCPTTIQFLYP